MARPIALRDDYTADKVRKLAAKARDAKQARRLLSIAAAYEGMTRGEAARLGGMDRQILRDWVIRFNAEGPDGLCDHLTEGPKPKLTEAQRRDLAELVEASPDVEKNGVVRWRSSDLRHEIEERFGVVYSTRSVTRILHELGFAHVSARPRHPAQDEDALAAFKKTSPPRWQAT